MDKINASFLGLLCVSGTDAKKLLQGQLTCDVNEITETHSSLAALCNPQGRVISLFQLFLFQENYYLQMPREMVAITSNILKKYAVFYKVKLHDASDEAIPPFNTEKNLSEWKRKNIEAGIPAIYPDTSEKFLPHEINLHLLNAISFNKGCYTGQEIIARMQHRGRLKKEMKLMIVQLDYAPRPGEDFYSEGKIQGIIVDSVEFEKGKYQILVILDIK